MFLLWKICPDRDHHPYLCVPFWVQLGVAKCPKIALKPIFWLFWTIFSYTNGPIDLVRGLFSSLDIGTHLPHLRICVYFFGSIWGCPDTPNRIKKNFFLVVFDHFSYMNDPIDFFRGLFSNLDIRTYILPTFRPLSTHLGPFGGAQMPQNSMKKTIFCLFQTLSPTRMGLFIWLGVYSQA
jgi:hypothetical protein